jgi:Ni,Fe-hydrogenase III large subunit
VARASGVSDDARSDNNTYRDLGFSLIRQQNGDLQARRVQLIEEVEQSLILTRRALQTRANFAADQVETPFGPLSAESKPQDKSHILEALLPGHEWGDAIAVIGSLPLAASDQREENPL